MGIPVAIVAVLQNNFKITTQDDYERAENVAILPINQIANQKLAVVSDVHALEKRKGENNLIRICGIDVEFERKIECILMAMLEFTLH